MKEITSLVSSKETILIHLKDELVKAIDSGKTDIQINLELDLPDKKVATFYMWDTRSGDQDE